MPLAIRLLRALALLCAGLLWGLGCRAAHPASNQATPASAIFHNYCSVCHGEKGDGQSRARGSLNPPPRDFTNALARADLTRDRMIAAVQGGVPGTAMVAWQTQLARPQIEAVVDYIRATFMHVDGAVGTAPPAARVDMALPLPAGLKGDASAGRRFYDANCATCHGVKGDGQGPRAYFINPKPRNFIAAASRLQFNRPALYAAVSAGKNGTEMPAWNQVLQPQEMANVAEYVFQTFVQPAAAKVAARTPP